MAAIFQIRRGSGSLSLVDGELYVNKGPDSLQYAVGEREITLAKLDELNTGSLYLKGGISASGDITASNAYFSGDVAISGNLFLGNNSSDNISALGVFTTNLNAGTTNTYNIGSTSSVWANIYANNISASSFTGSLYGMGDPTTFSQSVDNRLDRVEASSSLYDNAMSGSKRLYVSPSGSDSYDGKDPSTPFRTIKAAVASLYTDGTFNPLIPERTTIFVGSGEYTENNPIALPNGVAIVGDNLRTVRLKAQNPTFDYFHVQDGNYLTGLRFLDLRYPAFAVSFPASTATASISAGAVDNIGFVYTHPNYSNGETVKVIVEGPDAGGTAATFTAAVVSGNLQLTKVSGGSGYAADEKPRVSIQAPTAIRPFITTSPYIQNCSSITGPFTTDGIKISNVPGTPTYAELRYDVNDVRHHPSNAVIGSGIIDEQGAGAGLIIDGNLCSNSSPLRSMVADAFTQVNQGGPGHLVTNNGYAQFVSCFTTFCTYGFKVANGGFANVSNSVIDFGKYGLISKTYYPETYNTATAAEDIYSTVVAATLNNTGSGYTPNSTIGVTITGGNLLAGGTEATAEAVSDENGHITDIIITNPGSGYRQKPLLQIDLPTTGTNRATTINNRAEITNVNNILINVTNAQRGVDVGCNMRMHNQNYLVTSVTPGTGTEYHVTLLNITDFPSPAYVEEGDAIEFYNLSNISTGGMVMEYVGSGVTYNALPFYGGIPNRAMEVLDGSNVTGFSPGRVFYTTVDNIGNLKIGDYFSVNQLTGEVSITAESFNLTGLNSIGPFRRDGFDAGVVLNEVSDNITLINSIGEVGHDTVPTQFAVKGYVDPLISSSNDRLAKLEISSASVNSFTASAIGRLNNLESTSGSHNGRLNNLESKSASVDISLAEIHSYTSSLKQAITVTGTDASSTTTIKGNLVVQGTQTTLDSTTIQLGDNIIELNGSGVANAGLLVKDPTALNTVSGSLLWDSTLDYWKGGTLGNESKLLLAGGDGVLSGSTDFNAFSTSVDSRLSNLQTKSASVDISITNINSTTASLNTSVSNINSYTASASSSIRSLNINSASVNISVTNINSFTESVDFKFSAVASFTGSTNTKFSDLKTYTGSVNDRFGTLGQVTASLLSYTASANAWSGTIETKFNTLSLYTASVNQTTLSLNEFTESVNTKFGNLQTYTSSINGDLTKLHESTASLNLFSASVTASLVRITASIVDHEDRIQYLYDIGGIGNGNPLVPLNQFSASAIISIANLESFTSSINTTIKNKLNLDGVISGSSQIISILPSGVVSGSSQVNIYDVENFATFNDAISDDINGKEEVASATHTLVSGSSQITYGSISSIPAGIVSGSSQVTPLLPTGVISGSIQILGGSGVWSSSVQMPAGVVSGSSQVLGGSTIHSGSAGNYQFNSIGVNLTPTGVAGEIIAGADIVAFSSSDIRLKENIKPIENALSKVESISGNTYDWKEGYDTIHSHKGNDVGVIAQEIENILPQIVTNRDNGYKAVQYEKIIPLLVEAIKELSEKIKQLENK